MISYEPLWKTLEIKGYSTYWLLNHGVDSKTLYNLQIAIQNGHLCHVRRSVCDIIGGQPKTN